MHHFHRFVAAARTFHERNKQLMNVGNLEKQCERFNAVLQSFQKVPGQQIDTTKN